MLSSLSTTREPVGDRADILDGEPAAVNDRCLHFPPRLTLRPIQPHTEARAHHRWVLTTVHAGRYVPNKVFYDGL